MQSCAYLNVADEPRIKQSGLNQICLIPSQEELRNKCNMSINAAA